MADEDLSLNEDQLLDNLDDANGDLLNEVKISLFQSTGSFSNFISGCFLLLLK